MCSILTDMLTERTLPEQMQFMNNAFKPKKTNVVDPINTLKILQASLREELKTGVFSKDCLQAHLLKLPQIYFCVLLALEDARKTNSRRAAKEAHIYVRINEHLHNAVEDSDLEKGDTWEHGKISRQKAFNIFREILSKPL